MRPHGLWCATLTPLTASLEPDGDRLALHCAALLRAGCDGVAVFGTTGEGFAFSVAERRHALDRLAVAGLPGEKVIAGTGATALSDAVELTRYATSLGLAGTLVVPPFFLKDVPDDGVFAFFSALVERVADERLRLFLYNIPQLTAVAVAPAVARRLADRYPGIVAGIKDSSGDWGSTSAYLEHCPELALFVGHEPHLRRVLAAGGAGTICGIANVAPLLMRRFLDAADDRAAAPLLARIERLVEAVLAQPFIPAMKASMAAQSGEPAWTRVRPPLLPLADPDAAAIAQTIESLAGS